MTIYVGYPNTLVFYAGMRLGVSTLGQPQSDRWYARLWRWLMRRNWRIERVDHASGELVLRRSR